MYENQLYNTLDNLKIQGFPIEYSRSLKSYVYDDVCELEIVYFVNLLTTKEKINIDGGSLINFFTPMRLEWTKLY